MPCPAYDMRLRSRYPRDYVASGHNLTLESLLGGVPVVQDSESATDQLSHWRPPVCLSRLRQIDLPNQLGTVSVEVICISVSGHGSEWSLEWTLSKLN